MITGPWVGLGENGYTLAKAGTTFSGTFWAIVCLGRTTFTTLVDAGNTAASWAEVSLGDGTHIYGYFTDGTVSTGAAILYKVKL